MSLMSLGLDDETGSPDARQLAASGDKVDQLLESLQLMLTTVNNWTPKANLNNWLPRFKDIREKISRAQSLIKPSDIFATKKGLDAYMEARNLYLKIREAFEISPDAFYSLTQKAQAKEPWTIRIPDIKPPTNLIGTGLKVIGGVVLAAGIGYYFLRRTEKRVIEHVTGDGE